MNSSLRYALTTLGTALVVIALAVVVELVSYKHPRRWDLTETQRNSLAPQTVRVLEALERPVTLTLFIKDGDPAKAVLTDMLDRYRYYNRAFEFEAIDPDVKPGRARNYNLDQYTLPVAFFETEDGKRESVTGINSVDTLEEQLTNGLISATRGHTKHVYLLTGHREAGLEEGDVRRLRKAQAALQDKSYEVAPLQLLGEPRVPRDCEVLIVAGPAKELDPTEIRAVRTYLEGGGRALLALDPQTSVGLAAVAGAYGLTVGDDVVIDFNALNQLFGGDPLVPIAGSYGTHAITRNFTVATYFPEARSVEPAAGSEFNTTAIVQTSGDSFAETDFEELRTGRVGLNGADRRGPITIGAVVDWPVNGAPAVDEETDAGTEEAAAEAPGEAEPSETPPAKTTGRLAVFGDSDFFTDQHFEAMGNSDLFLNVVNWLAQEEDLIAIRPKSPETQYLTLSATQVRTLFLVPVVLLPGVVLAAGGLVWLRRSRGG